MTNSLYNKHSDKTRGIHPKSKLEQLFTFIIMAITHDRLYGSVTRFIRPLTSRAEEEGVILVR